MDPKWNHYSARDLFFGLIDESTDEFEWDSVKGLPASDIFFFAAYLVVYGAVELRQA